jgi:hypothetical protein
MADNCLLSSVVLFISLTRALASARGTSCIVSAQAGWVGVAPKGRPGSSAEILPPCPVQSQSHSCPRRYRPGPGSPVARRSLGSVTIAWGCARSERVLVTGSTGRSSLASRTSLRLFRFSGGKARGFGRQGGLLPGGEGWYRRRKVWKVVQGTRLVGLKPPGKVEEGRRAVGSRLGSSRGWLLVGRYLVR